MPPSTAPPDILADPDRTIDESTIEPYEAILTMETGAGFQYIKRCKWSSLRTKHALQLNPCNNTYLTPDEKVVLVQLAAKFVFNDIAPTQKKITHNARMVGVLFGTSDGTVTEAYYNHNDPNHAAAQAECKRQYMQQKREQQRQQQEGNLDEGTPLAVINQNGSYAGTNHHHNNVAASLEATAAPTREFLERQLAAMTALAPGQQQLALAPRVPRGHGRRSALRVPPQAAPAAAIGTHMDAAAALLWQLQLGQPMNFFAPGAFAAGASASFGGIQNNNALFGTVSRVEGGGLTGVVVRPNFCRLVLLIVVCSAVTLFFWA